ncbi:MAG: hypothetical protein ACRD0C_11910 [Acidimicrobiia bacterium]
MAKKDGWVARADTTFDYDEGTATARVELEHLPGWQVDVEVAGIREGTPLLRAVRLVAPPGEAVTTRALASVRTGAVLRAMRDDLAGLSAAMEKAGIHASPALARDLRRWMKGLSMQPGRKMRVPDVFLAQLAVEYENIARPGGSRTPTRDLAVKYGLDYSRIKNLLSEATYRELLIRGRQGVAGGRATDKAKELLRGTH